MADYMRANPADHFLYLGDVYTSGTAAEFTANYEPVYGPLAPKTTPVIGNHEYANRFTGITPTGAPSAA